MPDSAIRLPGPRDTTLLAVAVLAVSTSAPMIAACTAPALAIAFWRSILGAGATAPWLFRKGFGDFPALSRRQWVGLISAALFLPTPGHFTNYPTLSVSIAWIRPK